MSQTYTVTTETRGAVDIFTLRQGGHAAAVVAPAWGHNCFALQVHEPVLEPVAFTALQQRPTSYGIPILFPFPNRLRDGAFVFGGQRYVVNPNRHGFVRDKAWRVLDTGATPEAGAWISARFETAQYASAILPQFPFPFCLDVTYRLRADTLHMETVASNTGAQAMPAGFGIHPYFRRPAQGTVCVPASKRWALQDSLPTGALVDVAGPYDLRRPRDVGSLDLDDIYTDLTADTDGLVRCTLHDQQHGLLTTVAFAAAQFPHVVVFTPPAPRQAICIEPYTCPTDGLNLQQRGIESNLIVIQPGESRRFTISVATRQAVP